MPKKPLIGSGRDEQDRDASLGPLREIDAYFERARGEEPGRSRRLPELVMEQVERRARLAERTLASLDTLREFIDGRPDAHRVHRRIDAQVERYGATVRALEARASENADWANLSGKPPEEQYRLLARAGYIDVASAFDDVPPMPTLCEFNAVVGALKEGQLAASAQQLQQLEQQWQTALQLVVQRWQRITGRPMNPSKVPWVGELTERMAPIPLRPSWSEQLYAREARALDAEPPPGGAGAGAAAGQPAGDRRAPAPEATVRAAEAESEEVVAFVEAGLDRSCNADEILVRSGVPPLRPPAEGEPRHTFPGRLLQREDIFYDYAILMPVDECGRYSAEVTGTDTRSLSAIQVLAAQAAIVIDFLDSLDLADALGVIPVPAGPGAGQNVADEIRDALAKVLTDVDERTLLHEVYGWRRRFAEYAALVRDAARRNLLLGRLPGGQDPRNFEAALTAALDDMDQQAIAQYQEDRFRRPVVPEGTDMATYLEVKGRRIGDVRDYQGNQGHMGLDPPAQTRNLGPYLEHLGGEFHDVLVKLTQAAKNMRNAVANFQGAGQQQARDLERFASGQINEAVFVLARLLDGISEQIPLWATQPRDGSKRLGLLIIFRQYWTPEGYVKGKLVGHKNLLPAESTKIRRRTFIQTTTETTTVQEFARTRQEELSQTRKETAELLRENATKFNMSLAASGKFNIFIGSIDVTQTTGLDLSSMSRTTQSAIAEAAFKSSVSYNEKREVKIREERQLQEEFESENVLANPNQEITANYFYFQLLRQYLTTVELHDMRPVLLRTRYVPPEAAIDDKFLADHAHELLYALPGQLADDLQETVHEIDALARRLLVARVDITDRRVAYDALRDATPPANAEEARDREVKLASLLEALEKSKKELYEADAAYLKARIRLDRVVGHVRRNRTHYMQYIWQASPRTDEDRILREETFRGTPLPELTRGLQRQGYYGAEEIFDFTGPSLALMDVLLRVLRPGSELASLPRNELEQTTLFQQLRRYYTDEEIDDLLEQIANHAFVEDPAGPNTVLSSRRVQIAQDALVIETLPGQVPLLEGFKMAHRMLDVERACLENQHLAARIADRPWQQSGEDSYRVYRRDGLAAPVNEEGPARP